MSQTESHAQVTQTSAKSYENINLGIEPFDNDKLSECHKFV